MKTSRLLFLCCLFVGWAGSAQAIQIYLTGPSDVAAGGSFELDFYLDVSDEPILGGGTHISYDSSLVDFVDFQFASGLFCPPDPFDPCANNVLDPLLSAAPTDDGLGMLSLLAFGNFSGISSPTPLLLGTFTFAAIAPGLANFDLDPDTLAAWASDVPPFNQIPASAIDTDSAQVAISVGEPPFVLMLLLGLVTLLVARTRRSCSGSSAKVAQ